MNIYAKVAFVPHRHRTLWAVVKMFSLLPQPLLFPLFPLFLRSVVCFAFTHVSSVQWVVWAVGVLSGWRCYSLGVVLCERSRTRLIRHVRVLYELWPRRGSGHQNGEILNIYSGKRVCYSGVYIYISKAERCQHWHINFAHQRYN